MYSTHNEGTFFVAEKFIRTLKNKIYKLVTAVSKNVYFDKLDDISNNKYHITIKMKPIEGKDNTYIDSVEKVNDKDPIFKVGNHVKDLVQIGVKKFLWLKKLKILFQGHMVLMISMVKKLLEHVMKKNCKKKINKGLG